MKKEESSTIFAYHIIPTNSGFKVLKTGRIKPILTSKTINEAIIGIKKKDDYIYLPLYIHDKNDNLELYEESIKNARPKYINDSSKPISKPNNSQKTLNIKEAIAI
jgi:hypothetical protein